MDNTKSKFARRVEIATNLSIILVAMIGATVLIKNYLLRGPSNIGINQAASTGPQGSPNASQLVTNKPVSIPGPAEGSDVSLPGINWSESNETVVLALSNKCHFCTESAPFYQRLTAEL